MRCKHRILEQIGKQCEYRDSEFPTVAIASFHADSIKSYIDLSELPDLSVLPDLSALPDLPDLSALSVLTVGEFTQSVIQPNTIQSSANGNTHLNVGKQGPSREIVSIKIVGREKRIIVRDNATGIVSVIRKLL